VEWQRAQAYLTFFPYCLSSAQEALVEWLLSRPGPWLLPTAARGAAAAATAAAAPPEPATKSSSLDRRALTLALNRTLALLLPAAELGVFSPEALLQSLVAGGALSASGPAREGQLEMGAGGLEPAAFAALVEAGGDGWAPLEGGGRGRDEAAVRRAEVLTAYVAAMHPVWLAATDAQTVDAAAASAAAAAPRFGARRGAGGGGGLGRGAPAALQPPGAAARGTAPRSAAAVAAYGRTRRCLLSLAAARAVEGGPSNDTDGEHAGGGLVLRQARAGRPRKRARLAAGAADVAAAGGAVEPGAGSEAAAPNTHGPPVNGHSARDAPGRHAAERDGFGSATALALALVEQLTVLPRSPGEPQAPADEAQVCLAQSAAATTQATRARHNNETPFQLTCP
jgi:hypothetical protein